MDSLFRFKQFSVKHSKSGLKVGTDAVLLGSLIEIPKGGCQRVLDIGTGSGVIALMIAQKIWVIPESMGLPRSLHSLAMTERKRGLPRSLHSLAMTERNRGLLQLHLAMTDEVKIDAIDIDSISCEEAGENFENSPWKDCLSVINMRLQDYCPYEKYDLVFSNPPYFDNSLKNPDSRKATARHSDSLSFRELCVWCKEYLSEDGDFWVILPYDQLSISKRVAASFGLLSFKEITIFSTPKKAPKRIIIAFSKSSKRQSSQSIILNENGHISEQYHLLTKDYLLD